MPSVDFEEVRRLVSMQRVLELIDFQAAYRRGTQWRGSCPIHRSNSDSLRSRVFSVNLDRNVYQCFNCGAKGNQLDLWVAVTKLPIQAAAIDLCENAGVAVPWLHRN